MLDVLHERLPDDLLPDENEESLIFQLREFLVNSYRWGDSSFANAWNEAAITDWIFRFKYDWIFLVYPAVNQLF